MTRRVNAPQPPARPALAVAGAAVVGWNVGFLASRGESPWPAFTACAVASLVAAGALYRRDARALVGRPLRDAAVGLVAGVALAALTEGGHAVVAPALPSLRDDIAALYARMRQGGGPIANLHWLVLVILAEEVVFRGLLLDTLRRWLRPGAALALMALVYAVSQLGSGQLVLALVAAGVGGAWGGLRIATGGLVAPFVAHVVWDLSVLVLFPLQ